MVTICVALPSQKSWPSVFSCQAMPWCATRSMKSHWVYRDRADLQKCGLPDRKFSGPAYMLVKLQRPPPEMRIFSPGALAWSMTNAPGPAWAAHIMPAAPAPRISVLNCMARGFGAWGRPGQSVLGCFGRLRRAVHAEHDRMTASLNANLLLN